MRVGSARKQRLFAFGAAVVAALVVLSGCASLPESSAPFGVLACSPDGCGAGGRAGRFTWVGARCRATEVVAPA
ncbi:hypothetical protein [Nocardia brasiliensis]|uniref:hypothetical protein n=1 Tax=Nocardia brasiliensis TaxID=37326 RepID=UPI00245582AC|nr:hypothetical protein [Nocardia brasiliensis]